MISRLHEASLLQMEFKNKVGISTHPVLYFTNIDEVILINGQFPGPTIEANWGDMLMITVHNQISNPAEGIGMHWHGILQKKTQYYDGVASVTQCPIAPGMLFHLFSLLERN